MSTTGQPSAQPTALPTCQPTAQPTLASEMSLLDVLEPLCARGFLRQATRLSLTSKVVAAALPMGTGKQIYEAAKAGNDGQLTVYLEYWRYNPLIQDGEAIDFHDRAEVCNWGIVLRKERDSRSVVHFQFVDSPLVVAAENDRLACVELLVALAPKMSEYAPAVDVDKGDETAMHWACRNGNAAMVRVLLSTYNINVNQTTAEGVGPLHEAAQRGNAEIVGLLLAAKGIQLEPKNKLGATPMELARQAQHRKVAATLNKAIIAKRTIDVARKKIYVAAERGNVAKLRPLLEKWSGNTDVLDSAHYDPKTSTRYAPIFAAACKGQLEAVQLLAATPGVDVNRLQNHAWGESRTHLMTAAYYGEAAAVRTLLTVNGLDLNAVGECTDEGLYIYGDGGLCGNTALDLALAHYDGWECTATMAGRRESVVMLRAAGAEKRFGDDPDVDDEV